MSSNLIKYGLLAGAGYFLYSKFVAAPAGAIPGATATPATCPTDTKTCPDGSTLHRTGATCDFAACPDPAYKYVPPTTEAALIKAAGASTATADVWNFYYGRLPGKTALVEGFDAVFFPNGRPPDVNDTPKMSAAAFLAGLATKGLSGLGRAFPSTITVPAAAAILRARAKQGVKLNYLPAGTSMLTRGAR